MWRITHTHMNLTPLLDANAELLGTACTLLAGISPKVYSEPAPGVGHRVGPQIRHVIEFYICLLEGLDSGVVDYDARRREKSLETSPAAAVARMRSISLALGDASLQCDRPLRVRMEDAPAELGAGFLPSSLLRELQAVRSHTIHHFALIAVTLQARGIAVDSAFGVAPSTLRYRAA